MLSTAAAVLLVLLSLVVAAPPARTVARPVRRLGRAAREVSDGRFDLDPLEVRGPSELAGAAEAFNEMAATLADGQPTEDSDLGEALPRWVRRVAVAMERPVTIGSVELAPSVSIGASLLDGEVVSASALIARADEEMYRAKRARRARA